MSKPSRPPSSASPGGRLTSTIVAGLLAGLLSAVFAISHAAVLFSGPMQWALGTGVALALLAAVVHAVTVGLLSSHRATISGVSSEMVVLALVVTSVASHPAVADRPDAQLATVLALIAATSLLTGAAYLIIGTARLGSLIRYLPYPVMGGFFAGIGWLLLVTGFAIALRQPLELQLLGALQDPQLVWYWLPPLVTGLTLYLLQQRSQHYLVMPGVLTLACAAFYAIAAWHGLDLDKLASGGWLLGPLASARPDSITTLARDLQAVHWPLLLEALPQVLTVSLILVGGAMLVGPALEVTLRRSLDLDGDLRAAGIANLLAGSAGAPAGYPYLGTTGLAQRISAPHRAVPLLAAAVCVVLLVHGSDLIAGVPRLLTAALLFYLACSLLGGWLVQGWRRLARADYAVMLVVFLGTVVLGFMPGVAIGLGLGILFFALDYSRIDLVRRAFSGAQLRSRVSRTAPTEALLARHGEQILVLRLDGYIFFGTVNRLVERVRTRLRGNDPTPLAYLVLDLRSVRGFDSSAAAGFVHLTRLARDHGVECVVTGLAGWTEQLLRGAGIDRERRAAPAFARAEHGEQRQPDPCDGRLRVFDDLDHGLEWAENALLQRLGEDPGLHSPELEALLTEQLGSRVLLDALLPFTERRRYETGETICAQGERKDELYLVESGETRAVLTVASGERVRLRRMGAGVIIGEVALYLGGTRTASVLASEPTSVLVIRAEALERMRLEQPQLAVAFHAMMARLMAQRLADNTQLVDSLVG